MELLGQGPIISAPVYYNADNYLAMFNGCPQELPEDFEQIRNGTSPNHVKWKLVPLYKIDAVGTRRVWQIGFDGIYMWTLHGTFTSTKIEIREIILNTSGRTYVSQALQDTATLFKKKIHKGYAPIDTSFRPKLVGMKGVVLQKKSIKDWSRGMIADLKLDGLRMVSQCFGGQIAMCSNGNESYDHMYHIKEDLVNFVNYLPTNCVLDGELYNKGMTLAEINSAVRTVIRFNPESLRINYFIFDLDWDTKPCVEDRYAVLCNAFYRFLEDRESRQSLLQPEGRTQCSLSLVTKWMVTSYDDCMISMMKAVNAGYEGLMLRHPGGTATNKKQRELSQYRYGGRTTALYKVKTTISEEGPIIGVIAGQGRDHNLGILQIRDQITGSTVTIRWGVDAERMSWLQNPNSVIGRIFKYKYPFRDANSNYPVQPAGVGWRDIYC